MSNTPQPPDAARPGSPWQQPGQQAYPPIPPQPPRHQGVPFAQPQVPRAQSPHGYGYVPGAPGPVALELRKSMTQWTTPVLILLSVLAIGFVMSACLIGAASSSASGALGNINFVQLLLLGFGAVLGRGIDLEAGSYGGSGIAASSVGTIAAIAFATYVIARVSARKETGQQGTPGAIVVRSVAEALGVAIIVMVIALFGRTSIAFYAMAPAVVSVLLTVFIVVAFALIVARLRGRTRLGRAGALLTESGWYAMILVGVLSVATLIAAIFYSIDKGNLTALAWLPYGPNAGAYLAALGQFGQLQAPWSGYGESSVMIWDVMGQWSILAILLTFFTMLYLAVFIGARRGRAAALDISRVWQLPLAMFVITVLYTYTLGSVVVSTAFIGGSSREPAWIGLTFVTSLIVAAFALVVSLLAETLPGVAYGMSPALFGFLAGKRAASFWIAGNYAPQQAGWVNPTPPGAYGDPVAAGAVAGAPGTIPSGLTRQPHPQIGQQPGYGYGPVALPPRQPLSKKAKRRLIGWSTTLGVLLLLFVGGVIALNIVNASRGPEAAVKEYLTLIADGKAEEASALVPPLGDKQSKSLLTNAVMNADGVERMKVGKITSTVDGETGTVTAQLTVDGETFTAKIPVSQGEKEFLVLNTWQIDRALTYDVILRADKAKTTAKLAGAEVTLNPYGSQTFQLYPGSYPVTSSVGSKFYEGTNTTAVVGPEGDTSVTVENTLLTDEVEAVVLEKVKAALTACATVPTNMDRWCPSALRNTALASLEVTEQITDLSSLSGGSSMQGTFVSGRGKITIVPNATAINPTPTSRTVNATLYGKWKIDGDDITVTFSMF